MDVIRFGFIQFKRMLKDKKVLALMVLASLIIIGVVGFISNKINSSSVGINVAFNVLDKGYYGDKLIKDLKIEDDVHHEKNSEKVLESLKNNDIIAIYEIPKNFTEKIRKGEKPIINTYKREKGNGTDLIEKRINEEINKMLKVNLLLKNKIIKNNSELYNYKVKVEIKRNKIVSDNSMMTSFILISYIFFTANYVVSKVLSLRKQNILKRAITTPNRPWKIIGGIYIGMFFTIVLIYSIIALVGRKIAYYPIEYLPMVIINVILMTLIAMSVGVFLTRISKNEGLTSMIVSMIGTANVFLGFKTLGNNAQGSIVLNNLTKLSPFYWSFDSIKNLKLFPNAIILILIALVFFTAGNIKLRNFVND